MSFVSTQDPRGASWRLADALRLGPAPDGGLFMPQRLEPFSAGEISRLLAADLATQGAEILGRLWADEAIRPRLAGIAQQALNFPIPLNPVSDAISVLEIFHGPTLAFKDVGARFLARLLAATRPDGDDGTTTVLVATSGDTGGAVAQAFHGVEGTRVVILYPEGRVSPRQERQFTTLGDNVLALAVDGAFDDCQRLVNEAFADRELAERARLTSANSINVGRLLPQIIYYFHAVGQARRQGHEQVLFCTPSGNFGNLTAGLMAKKLGLPCRFVAATNANDVVPVYLETGVFEPRPSQETLSNAMDVGRPNNFARIQHLYSGDLAALQRDVIGYRVSDEETRSIIARVYAEKNYLLDPHTAVGWGALECALETDRYRSEHGVVLGTAHPAKFGEVVEPVVREKIEIPDSLARHMLKEVKSERISNRMAPLRERILGWV